MRAIKATPPVRNGTVAIVVYDDLTMFEFSCALEVFSSVLKNAGPLYEVLVCGTERTVTAHNGLRLVVPYGLKQLHRADTIVVPPMESAEAAPEEVLRALRRAHARGARLVSLCTGVFSRAAAGLIDGRRATTHWTECAELARRYPSVRVDPDVLYVDDGDILTSAGSAASLDLCLHIVRQDHGAEVVTELARELVVPPYRDGGQAQYIERPQPIRDEANLFSATLTWATEHLAEPLGVQELADRALMSRRTFARNFTASTGTTPYQWLLAQRLRLAQELLETTDLGVDQVATRSGFDDASVLRKHFRRLLQTSPQAYRRTFRAAG
jgi:AraC family transcriptional regulator, transcriptional activator FtrA